MINKKQEKLENELEIRAEKREKKKRKKMRVSGAGVKRLQKIIKDKA